MKLIWHNVTVEIPDDDPRLAIIQLLLFGGAPLPMFGPAPVAPTVAATPVVAVPDKFRAFWKALPSNCRVELVMLATGPKSPAEIAWETRTDAIHGLQGLHFSIARVARAHKIGEVVFMSGHDRKHRRVQLVPELLPWVNGLKGT